MGAVDVNPRDDLAGCLVGGGKFRLDRLLGTGATGCVYLGHQLNLDRPVAVKVLRREFSRRRDVIERFYEEAMLASRLNHPNIASIVDCSVPGDEVPFIAMEYVAGESLYKLIQRETPLHLDRVIDLFHQVLAGLEEAHEAGVIHADLKSPNIVVTHTRGGLERPKLVDFGIAISRTLPHHPDGTLCGTPEYLAPEVIRGHRPTPSSDIYGAGIILYELVTGSPPFTGRSLDETLLRHLEEPVPDLTTGDDALLEQLDRVIHRALAKDPRSRFRTVAEFRAAVVAASVNSRARDQRPETIEPRQTKPARTERETVDTRRPACADVRERLRDAILAGDAKRIVDGYLELAAALARIDRPETAQAELEQGIDLVCSLTPGKSQLAWRLQLALAAARAETGDRDGAITEALRALNRCQRRHIAAGCLRAHELLARLYAAGDHHHSASRHREAAAHFRRRLELKEHDGELPDQRPTRGTR